MHTFYEDYNLQMQNYISQKERNVSHVTCLYILGWLLGRLSPKVLDGWRRVPKASVEALKSERGRHEKEGVGKGCKFPSGSELSRA